MRAFRFTIAVAALSSFAGTAAAQSGAGVGVSLDVERIVAIRAKKNLVYSAKFLCGEIAASGPSLELGQPLAPGSYRTAVNIHNPNEESVEFTMKAVIANSQSSPRGPIGILKQEVLRPDEALEVDCRDIADLVLGHSPSLANGFVVIKVSVPLGSRPVTLSNRITPLGVVVVTTVNSTAPGGIVPTDRPDLLIDPDSRVLDRGTACCQNCEDKYISCRELPEGESDSGAEKCRIAKLNCINTCEDAFRSDVCFNG